MDMQARRDAFTFITDERPPAETKRWLVTWSDESGSDDWSQHDRLYDAWEMREGLSAQRIAGTIHDLDNQ